MNAPEHAVTAPPTGSIVARLALDQIAPSATNPRKTFNATYISSLAGTIIQHGVIQPITVRPWPVSRPAPKGVLYEIVVGECRYRGSVEAGAPDIPAFWRELTDQQVLEIQVIENLQREDVHPLEEADGYQRLMKEFGHSAEGLGERVGKSKAYIYARIKLLALCPKARAAFYAKGLDASTALLIARIPDPALQEQATKEIVDNYGRGAMSYRDAKEHLERKYMLRLADATFNCADEALLKSAGSCTTCPKRTGNQKDLFADVKGADICTDPPCYEAKGKAHIVQLKANAKTDGRKIIDGDAAKKIKPYEYTSDLSGGYIELDKKMYDDPKHRTLRQILGKDAPKADLLINPHKKGAVIEVLAKASIADILKAKGLEPRDLVRQGKSAAEKETERKRKVESTYRQRLFDRVRGQLSVDFDTREDDTPLDGRELRMIAGTLFRGLQFEDQKRLARLWIGPTDKSDDHSLVRELQQNIATLGRKDTARLLIECTLVGEIPVANYGDSGAIKLQATAEALNIDAAEIKRTVSAESKAKVQPKTAKVKANPAAKTAPTPLPAAQARGPSGLEKTNAALAKQIAAVTAKSKAKVKGNPAPALPANEPTPSAKPAGEMTQEEAFKAWPFPTGSGARI